MINIYSSNLKDFELKRKTETAFYFLKNLANELKIIKKDNKKTLIYEEMKKAINENNVITSEEKCFQLNKEQEKKQVGSHDKLESYLHTDINKTKVFSDDKIILKKIKMYNYTKEFSLILKNDEDEDKIKIKNKLELKEIKPEGKIKKYMIKRNSISISDSNKLKNNLDIITLNECDIAKEDDNLEILYDNNLNRNSVFSEFKPNLNKNIKKKILRLNSYSNTPINNHYKNLNISLHKIDSNSIISDTQISDETFSNRNTLGNQSSKFSNIILLNAPDSFKSSGMNSFKIHLLNSNIDEYKNKNTAESENNFDFKNYYNDALNDYGENNRFHSVKKKNNFSNLNYSDYFDISDNKFSKDKLEFIKIKKNRMSEDLIREKKRKKIFNFIKPENKREKKDNIIEYNLKEKGLKISNKELYQKNKRESEILKIKPIKNKELVKDQKENYEYLHRETKIKNSEKNNYIPSTDTSSFIQLKKMQNEEYSNSKEKNQRNIINLLTNEEIENEDDQLNDNFIYEKINNDILDESKISTKYIDENNLGKNFMHKKNSTNDKNLRFIKKDLNVVKLIKCPKTKNIKHEKNINEKILKKDYSIEKLNKYDFNKTFVIEENYFYRQYEDKNKELNKNNQNTQKRVDEIDELKNLSFFKGYKKYQNQYISSLKENNRDNYNNADIEKNRIKKTFSLHIKNGSKNTDDDYSNNNNYCNIIQSSRKVSFRQDSPNNLFKKDLCKLDTISLVDQENTDFKIKLHECRPNRKYHYKKMKNSTIE